MPSGRKEPSQYIPFGGHPPPLASGLALAALHGEAHTGSPRTPVLPCHGAVRPGDAPTVGVGSLGVLVGSLGVRDAVPASPASRGAGPQRVNS